MLSRAELRGIPAVVPNVFMWGTMPLWWLPGAPLLLDVYCGAGGAGMGYRMAGFNVIGCDHKWQPRYPFPFVQMGALEFIERYGARGDAIHTSPPCQFASTVTPDPSRHHNYIPDTRAALINVGKPWIIENVPGAKRHLNHPIMVCGAQLGLKVYRHRYFESNVLLMMSPHIPHHDQTPSADHKVTYGTKSGAQSMHRVISPKGFISVAGHFSNVPYARRAMDIPWMIQGELAEAIPPAYTHYIGAQLMRHVMAKREATNAH